MGENGKCYKSEPDVIIKLPKPSTKHEKNTADYCDSCIPGLNTFSRAHIYTTHAVLTSVSPIRTIADDCDSAYRAIFYTEPASIAFEGSEKHFTNKETTDNNI